MRLRYIMPLGGVAAFLAFGCPSGPRPSAIPDAATAAPEAARAGAAADAGPQPLPGATLVAVWDGGMLELPSLPDASVPPSALLRFSTAAQLEDVRVRVLDDQDRMQPSHAVVSVSDRGTRVALDPRQPLPARACCRFAVDGERQPLPRDVAGHRFQPFQVRFSVWAPPAPSASARPRHRRRRRRHR